MLRSEICDTNRLPLGRIDFSSIRKRNKIYVDKTELILKIAEQDSPIFFSRPRRFGKSLLINTLHSLFEKGLEDFHCLDIEKKWTDTTYKVIHLDFSRMVEDNIEDIRYKLSKKIIQQFSVYNICFNFEERDFMYPDIILDEIFQKLSDYSIVLLIDEYDAPLTHNIDKIDILHDITNIFDSFYATIKQYTDKFRFIFITGVTKASHVSIFSAFNNLKDLSLRKEFNSLLGFTSDDLVQYFDVYVENAARILNMSKNDVYTRLEQYYDGFQFSINAKETLYNPWSLLSFFDSPEEGFKNYWFKSSGSSSVIMQYLKISDSFTSLTCEYNETCFSEDVISDRHEISSIPIYILLLQTGYLTIRKKSDGIARLVFPNAEVEESILKLAFMANNLEPDIKFSDDFQMLSLFIDQKNLCEIIRVFNEILNECVSILSNTFMNERSIRDILYAALPQKINLQKIKERETSKGFSDLELLTQKSHMVIEFKRAKNDRDAQASLAAAIEQLRRKGYGVGAFKDRTLYRVAMVISTEKKAILPEFCKEVLFDELLCQSLASPFPCP